MYHFIIAACAILMTALAYRNHIQPGFAQSFVVGAMAMIGICIALVLIGAMSS